MNEYNLFPEIQEYYDYDYEPLAFGYTETTSTNNHIKVGELVIGALIFLTVLTWVDTIFYDLKESDLNIDPIQRSKKKSNRLLFTLLLTIITIIFILLYNNYQTKISSKWKF